LVNSGRVVGALGLDCENNELVVIKAKSVVLATGSYSHIFAPTTVSPFETGDGHGAAYRAGAELIDMETCQFVATDRPFKPESVFLNIEGEDIMPKYGIDLKSRDKATKEYMCYAIWKEVMEGKGTDKEKVYIDVDGNRNPSSPLDKLIQTAPQAHTTIGGVKINGKCETSLPGLYAGGAIGGGVYGHARPQGYTSMITLVFGRIAGENASLGAAATESVEIDELQLQNAINSAIDTKRQLKNINPRDIKKQIKVIMRTHCWVIREEKSLIEGLSKIADLTNYLKNKGVDNSDNPSVDGYEWARYLELYNLLLASKLMIEGSLIRKESRGAYNRFEYPDTDNVNWLKNLVYKNIDGESSIDAIPVDLKYCAPPEFAETT
jgi:succinate dehydrogenase/fumarate reductase flavoprotein subunit